MNDPSKPVVLIDGKSLVLSCIDNEIGFVFKPIFSRNEMDIFTNAIPVESPSAHPEGIAFDGEYIEKMITANDIRTRIISVPKAIMNQIGEDIVNVIAKVNYRDDFMLNIDKSRRYLGGVTEILRKYSLLSVDGVAAPKLAKWFYDAENNVVNIAINV